MTIPFREVARAASGSMGGDKADMARRAPHLPQPPARSPGAPGEEPVA